MQFKRGDTFDFSGPVEVTQSGAPVTDFTGWEARSQIRDWSGTLVADLAVTWLSRAPGAIRLVAPDTSNWPASVLSIDVEFVAPDGSKVSTATENITVVEDVSR